MIPIATRTTTTALPLLLLILGSCATAFVTTHRGCGKQSAAAAPKIRSGSSSLQATVSRREVGKATIAAALSSLMLIRAPEPAVADLDYARVQDLLGNSDSAVYVPQGSAAPAAGKRPTYLKEPTVEFKENESKATDFKRKNLQAKQAFVTVLEKMETTPNNEDALAKVLDDMRYQVKANGGLPTGVTKEEVVKACRRRKAKKFWPTDVEIA